MRRHEACDVKVSAHELNELVSVGALFGRHVGVVHVIDDTGDRLTLVLLAQCSPPVLRCLCEVGLRVNNLIPL